MEPTILNYLTYRLKIFDGSNMFFEQYATEQMINLFNDLGAGALKDSLQGAIDSKGVDAIAKMFFKDTLNDINKLIFKI